mmetsp:Transcript_1762/g.3990  ORF Transcript_1762/g.3990 Transcript_1762/m.3990 type:complete len:161 (+) Transcript_1762:34-516(+)
MLGYDGPVLQRKRKHDPPSSLEVGPHSATSCDQPPAPRKRKLESDDEDTPCPAYSVKRQRAVAPTRLTSSKVTEASSERKRKRSRSPLEQTLLDQAGVQAHPPKRLAVAAGAGRTPPCIAPAPDSPMLTAAEVTAVHDHAGGDDAQWNSWNFWRLPLPEV